MAKHESRKRREPEAAVAAPPPAAIGLGYDPTGKTEPVDIVAMKDGWSEYTLADGTVLRVKAVILDVRRAVDQYSANGDPVYIVQATIVNHAKAPEKLKKGK